MRTLNEVYSFLSARRRYEVWFLRMGLADGSGAWWFRYLLTNPGSGGCPQISRGLPVQVWATWFPRDGQAQTFLQEFSLQCLELSRRGEAPFYFRTGENEIGQNSCRGALQVAGHQIAWNLDYRSTFRVTLSNKGWIGFSRTPHSNARFSGSIPYIRSCIQTFAEDLEALAPKLPQLSKIPTLIIWGDRDPVVEVESGYKLQKALGAELEIMPGIGHLPYEENPAEFSRIVKDFVTG
jgi:pimeloyl-ACP methyl ester carboxylesterase